MAGDRRYIRAQEISGIVVFRSALIDNRVSEIKGEKKYCRVRRGGRGYRMSPRQLVILH